MCVTSYQGAAALWTKGLTAAVRGAERRSRPLHPELHMTPCFYLASYLDLLARLYCLPNLLPIRWPYRPGFYCYRAMLLLFTPFCQSRHYCRVSICIFTPSGVTFVLFQSHHNCISRPFCILYILSNSALQKSS